MTAFKLFLKFYFFALLIIIVITLLFSSNFFYVTTNPWFWILPALFCFFGFLIGVLIYELTLRPAEKKKKIFFISYSLGILALLIVIAFQGFDTLNRQKHKKEFGNVEANRNVMKDFVYDNEEYIRIAFNRLESEFKDPNDFKLDAFSVRKKDTIINYFQDTIYTIYFVYFLKSDTSNKYFSRVSVLAGKPELKLYNIDIKKSEEYLKIKTEKEKQEHEVMRDIKNIPDRMKDSLKNNSP